MAAVLITVLLFQGGLMAKPQSGKQPNLLFIFPDQYRQYAMSFWSQPQYQKYRVGAPDPVKTPHIDKLAEEGIVFSRAVSNYPLCSPYRGMLLSGQYPEKNGIWMNCRKDRADALRQDAQCVTDVFYEAGYNTAYFGKCHWHRTDPLFDQAHNFVGITEAPGGHYTNHYDTYVPPGKSRHSIEYFYQTLRDSHFDPICYSNIAETVGGKKDGQAHLPKRYTPELESECVIDYLRNKQGQRAENKPFCLLWALNPPHNPWDKENCDLESYERDYKGKSLDKLLQRENADHAAGDYAPFYFANVDGVDRYVGKVLDVLETEGLADNTIVVFTSDHGEMLGSHGKQGKVVIQRESFSIPFIIRWPKCLQHRVEDLLISVPDVLPTLLGLAGLETQIPAEVEGTNYARLLVSPEAQVQKPKSALYLAGQGGRGVYTGRYTLSVSRDRETNTFDSFIYDNEKDPYQKTKIPLAKRPKVSEELLKELAQWLKKTNDPWYQKKMAQSLIPY